MVTVAAINAEIAQIKSNMQGLDSDNVAVPQLQMILNELQRELVVATAGQGAGIGSMAVAVLAPPHQRFHINSPELKDTRYKGAGALATLLGIA